MYQCVCLFPWRLAWVHTKCPCVLRPTKVQVCTRSEVGCVCPDPGVPHMHTFVQTHRLEPLLHCPMRGDPWQPTLAQTCKDSFLHLYPYAQMHALSEMHTHTQRHTHAQTHLDTHMVRETHTCSDPSWHTYEYSVPQWYAHTYSGLHWLTQALTATDAFAHLLRAAHGRTKRPRPSRPYTHVQTQ